IAARFSTCLAAIRSTSVVVRAVTHAAADDEAARQRELSADAEASPAPASTIVAAAPQGAMEEIPADAVYLLTGYRADSEVMCRAGIMLNDRQAPKYDPETFETNVQGIV